MEKSKLGITVTLMAAAVYLVSMFSLLAGILLAGYILLREEDAWLRRSAVKAIVIVLVFALALELVGMLDNLFAFLNVILGWFTYRFTLDYPLGLDILLRTALGFVRSGLLLVLGLSALFHRSVKAGPVDRLVDKNM